ncbi:MAG: hypothetical protein ACRD1E_13230 [Terriglobales bacterium]
MTRFYVIFHGPWVFMLDSADITALAVPCPGHAYVMGDTPKLTAIGQGLYTLTNPAAVAPDTTVVPSWPAVQAELAALPHGGALPDLTDPSQVRCAFELPLTTLVPAPYVLRSGAPSDFCDNLLSGRNFRHLANAAPGQQACLGIGQVLPYLIQTPGSLGLTNTEGATWTPTPDAQGNVVMHIYGETMSAVPSTMDHFAMTAAALGLDLHLDGPDVNDQTPIITPKLPLAINFTPLPGAGQLQPQTIFVPLLCGGNLVIRS